MTLPPRLESADSVVKVPTTIHGYEIFDVLGHGGMGVVYRAKQTALKRIVALKTLRAGERADIEERTRFLTEAESVATIYHPNIVQVYDFGIQEGLAYYAMEFCPGGTLAQKLGDRPLPPLEAAAICELLGRAIHVAHQANILHRDLKPANVLLGGDGTPKVSDFGLAKKLDERGQTHSGAVMGTPSYMAPEQATGSKTIGPSADIYSLGAILYECLTGRPPFRGATAVETMQQAITDDPIPPRSLNRGVPRDLETIVLKCLHKDPARRYGSAAAFADDLRRWQQGEPIRARPAGRAERVWKWVRRNPTAAALVAVSAVAVTALGALAALVLSR